ncbi:MAG: hypothetical protein AAFX76_01360 [Planctomycetota bacterium]
MITLTDGQCGLCKHYGEEHADTPKLVQIRTTHTAPEDYKDTCGHPKLEPLSLTVTADSGCQGFEAAA